MNKTRLEAFSDGVLAIIITIMVLEIKVPHGAEWSQLRPLLPTFLSYLLSFVYVGIYWGNHHHLLHSLKNISSAIIWANLSLLFCLSLIPFATGWMGENEFASNTVFLYGIVLLSCSITFFILQKAVEQHRRDIKQLKTALNSLDKKGIASTIANICALPLAYVSIIISGVIFVAIAIVWLVPDKNIERALMEGEE